MNWNRVEISRFRNFIGSVRMGSIRSAGKGPSAVRVGFIRTRLGFFLNLVWKLSKYRVRIKPPAVRMGASAFRVIFALKLKSKLLSLSLFHHFPIFKLFSSKREGKEPVSFRFFQTPDCCEKSSLEPRKQPRISPNPSIWYFFLSLFLSKTRIFSISQILVLNPRFVFELLED